MGPIKELQQVVWPQIAIFGDSLTQFAHSYDGGWGSMLAERYSRQCDIVTRGFSGYNTNGCRSVLPRCFNRNNTKDIVAFVIWLGANDAAQTKQYVSVEEFAANLIAYVEYLKAIGVTNEKIIIVSPPPVDGETWSRVRDIPEIERMNTNVEEYVSAVEAIGRKLNVTTVDMYNALLKENDWQSLFNDGLHFNRKGSQRVFDTLLPVIDSKVKKHAALKFPPWDELDFTDSEKSIQEYFEKLGDN